MNNKAISTKNNEPVKITEFVKTLSRDTTLFTQCLWTKGMDEIAEKKLGRKNPYQPLFAHYVKDGVVEIWENEKGVKWFLDQLLERNHKDKKFLKLLLAEFMEVAETMKKIHARELLKTQSEIDEYIDLFYRGAFLVSVFYYTGMDERNPQSAMDIALKARGIDFFSDNDAFIKKCLARIGGLSLEQAGMVLASECTAIPAKKILDQRLKRFLLVDGRISFLGNIEDFARQHPEFIFRPEELIVPDKEIRGQIACRGVVRGRVRIVMKQSDAAKVESGDILVSPMTTPNFISAMKLAAAFVTDEGGITCHAAIVAREMNKPCIIGTRIATKVLKDGDFAEVDAEKGLVRVIRKVEI